SSTRYGLYRYYFPAGMVKDEKDILQVLSQETAREILMLIIERGNPTQREISSKIMISSASVNWHIRRLKDLDVIREEKEGRYKRYRIYGDSKLIVALLRSYYPSIWDNWSNRLAEMFLSLSRGEEES
ncbi:MAG TPA: winged helix-turn-helix domain-containing protein, partial [Nitrososphaera sp.]|nr:winged helix-turn-helix domain-containing protein [Nitrososphaera sp.]